MADDMLTLILTMEGYMGRTPTEDEVYNFIMGTDEERQEIVNNARAEQ